MHMPRWEQEGNRFFCEIGPLKLNARQVGGVWVGNIHVAEIKFAGKGNDELSFPVDTEMNEEIRHERLSYVQMLLKDKARRMFNSWVIKLNGLDENGIDSEPYWYEWHLPGGLAGEGGVWDEGTLTVCAERIYTDPNYYKEDDWPLGTSLNRRKEDLERAAKQLGLEWRDVIKNAPRAKVDSITDFMNGV